MSQLPEFDEKKSLFNPQQLPNCKVNFPTGPLLEFLKVTKTFKKSLKPK